MLIELTELQKDNVSQTDLTIIQWINDHEGELHKYSISDIADKTFTSAATVSRTIKKCGFAGIAELRYRFSSSQNLVEDGVIVNQIMSNLLAECRETIEGLEIDQIQEVINQITMAKRIYIVAQGTTTLIARYFEFQLHLLGYNAVVLEDAVLMKISNKLFTSDDLVIIFSVKNSMLELATVAKHAKEKGSTVITCCCVNGTSLMQYSDIYVYGKQRHVHVIEDFDLMSNLPLHLISRIIIDYLML